MMVKTKWLKSQIRKIAHDLYYWRAGRGRVEFALRCRDVVARIDTGEAGPLSKVWLRTRFHLTLCKACSDYRQLSQAFSKAAAQSVTEGEAPDLKRLTETLLRIHARKETESQTAGRPETQR